jgi:hypothetical protein
MGVVVDDENPGAALGIRRAGERGHLTSGVQADQGDPQQRHGGEQLTARQLGGVLAV